MFKSIILLLTISSSVLADTGSPYNPQRNGSSITYNYLDIQGIWYPINRTVSVISRYMDQTTPNITVSCSDITAPSYGTAKIFKTLFNGSGGIFDAVGIMNGTTYFGEVGAPLNGIVVSPAEPKLPIPINGGEHYEIDHQVTNSQSGTPTYYVMHTSYYTVGHFASWGPFTDCWWTSLVEDEGTPHAKVYQYVYANGIGLVDLWWGPIDQNNRVGTPTNPAHELYAISFN